MICLVLIGSSFVRAGAPSSAPGAPEASGSAQVDPLLRDFEQAQGRDNARRRARELLKERTRESRSPLARYTKAKPGKTPGPAAHSAAGKRVLDVPATGGRVLTFERGALPSATPEDAARSVLDYLGSLSVVVAASPDVAPEDRISIVEVSRAPSAELTGILYEEYAGGIRVEGASLSLTLDAAGNVVRATTTLRPVKASAWQSFPADAEATFGEVLRALEPEFAYDPPTRVIISGEPAVEADVWIPDDGRRYRAIVNLRSRSVVSLVAVHFDAGRILEGPMTGDLQGNTQLDLPWPGASTSLGAAGVDGSVPDGELTSSLASAAVAAVDDDLTAQPTRTFAADEQPRWTTGDAPLPLLNTFAQLLRGASFADARGYGLTGEPVVAHVHAEAVDALGGNGCAAWYDPPTRQIQLGRSCQGVDLGLATDIILHEFGHALQSSIYALRSQGQSGALAEGFADFVAASVTGDPTVGEGVLDDGRSLANDLTIDDLTGAIHEDGRLIGGILWDLRASLGRERAETLALAALRTYPVSYDGLLYGLLAVANPGGDPTTLTAEQATIVAAFEARGIGPGVTGFATIPTEALVPVDPGTADTGSPQGYYVMTEASPYNTQYSYCDTGTTNARYVAPFCEWAQSTYPLDASYYHDAYTSDNWYPLNPPSTYETYWPSWWYGQYFETGMYECTTDVRQEFTPWFTVGGVATNQWHYCDVTSPSATVINPTFSGSITGTMSDTWPGTGFDTSYDTGVGRVYASTAVDVSLNNGPNCWSGSAWVNSGYMMCWKSASWTPSGSQWGTGTYYSGGWSYGSAPTSSAGELCNQAVTYYARVNDAVYAGTANTSKYGDPGVPVTSASYSGTWGGYGTGFSDPTYWFSSTGNVTLSYTDSCNPTGATHLTRYCSDTTNVCSPATTYSIPVAVGALNTTTYVRAWTRDQRINQEATQSFPIRIDTTLPSNPATVTASTNCFNNGLDCNSANPSVTWTYTAGSDTAGICDYQYVLQHSGGTWVYSGYVGSPALTFTLNASGLADGATYYTWIRSVDCAGNHASAFTKPAANLRIDLTAPTAPGAMTTTWVGDHYVRTSFTAGGGAGATDSFTGIRGYRLCRSNDNAGGCSAWVGSEVATPSVSVSGTDLPTSGTYRYYYWYAWDNANNLSTNSSPEYVRMDSAAPTSSVTTALEVYTQNTPITISWSGSDTGGSGLLNYDVQYKKNAGAWTNCALATTATSLTFPSGCSSPPTVANGDTFYFQTRARDAVGNVEAYPGGSGDKSTTFDLVNPSCTASIAEGTSPACQYVSGTTIYYNNLPACSSGSGSHTVTASVTVGGSPIAFVSFPQTVWIGGQVGPSPPYTKTYTYDSADTFSGAATIYAFAESEREGSCSFTTTRDVVAPAGGSFSYVDGYYTALSVPLSFTNPTDALSGIASRVLQRDGALTLSGGACSGSFPGTWPTTVSTNPASSPTNDTTVASGNCYRYRYVVTDNVGNALTRTSASVAKVDALAPTSAVTALSTYKTAASWTVAWSGSDTGGSGLLNYDVQYKKNAGAWTNCALATTATSLTFPSGCSAPPTVASGDVFYFQSRARDVAGNVEAYINGSGDTSTTVDLVNPSCTLSIAEGSSPACQHVSGTTVYYNNLVGCASGTGTHTVTAATVAGGSSVASVTFPTTVSVGEKVNSPPPFALTYTYDSADTFSALGTATVTAASGRTGTCSFTTTRDVVAPAGGSFSYLDMYYPMWPTITFSNPGDGTGSGIASRVIQRDGALTLSGGACSGSFPGTWPTTVSTNPASSPVTDSTAATNNCYRYRYLVTDNVGNALTLTSASVAKVDFISPSVAFTFPAAGTTYWNSLPASYSGTASDAASGFGTNLMSVSYSVGAAVWETCYHNLWTPQYRYGWDIVGTSTCTGALSEGTYYDTGSVTLGSWTVAAGASSPQPINDVGDGDTFCANALVYDQAGNAGYTQRCVTYREDDAPPTVSVASVAGDTTTPYWDKANDSQTNVVLNAADSGGVSECRMGASSVPFSSLPASSCTAPSGGTSSCAMGSLAQAASYSRYYSCRDTAGNASATAGVAFGVDWTAPTVPSVSGTTPTNDTTPTLTLSASDALSGMTNGQMRFSCNGSSWTTAVTYATSSSSFNVTSTTYGCSTADGTRTVYAQFADVAGTWSANATTSIVLDRVTPTSAVDSLPQYTTVSSWDVTWTGSDDRSGILNYDVQYKKNAGAWTNCALATTATTLTFPSGCTTPPVVASGDLFAFQSRARDLAGNVEVYPGGSGDTSTTVDLVNPSCNVTGITEDVSPSCMSAQGSTVFYNNNVACASGTGSFTVAVEVAAGGSAIANVLFPATVSAGGLYSAAPYENQYTYNSSSTYTIASVNATVTAASGRTGTCAFGVRRDTVTPTGGSVASYNGTQTPTNVTVTVSPGADALAGMATSNADYLLEAAYATLAGGTCGSFGGYADAGVAEAAAATSYTFTGDSARCYTFRYSVKDDVGNAATWTGTDVTVIDGTTPNIVAVDAGSGTNVPPVNRTSLTSGTPFNSAATGSDGIISFSWANAASPSGNLYFTTLTRSSDIAFDDEGLVGYWDFDEPSVFPDRSGNGNDGTITGSTFVPVGRQGGARDFAASTDRLDVPDDATLDLADNVTLEFWMYPKANTSTTQTVLVQKFSSTSDGNFRVYLYGASNASYPNRFIVYANRGGVWGNVSPVYTLPALDTWYHVAWTYSSATGGKIYINGVQQGTTAGSGVLMTNAQVVRIGTSVSDMDVTLDEVRLSNRVLDATEIAGRASAVAVTTPYIDGVTVTEGTQYMHVLPKSGAGVLGTARSFTAIYDVTAPTYVGASVTQCTYQNGSACWVRSGDVVLVEISHSDDLQAWRQYFGLNRDDCTPASCPANDEIKSHVTLGTFTDLLTYDTAYDITAATCVDTDASCADDDATYQWSTTAGTAEGNYKLHTYFYDRALNGRGYTDLGQWVNLDNSAPTATGISYLNGFQSTTGVALTLAGTDTLSGVVTTPNVDVRSCVMTAGSCAPSGGYTDATVGGSFPSVTSAGVHGSCYQYQYTAADNVGNGASAATSASVACIDTAAPTGASITYGTGYQTTTGIALTVGDGTDVHSGVNTASRTVQARSCAMSGSGTCTPSGAYSTVATTGTYPTLTYTATSGSCSQLQYLVSDNAGNQATATSGNVRCVDTAAPTGQSISYANGFQAPMEIALTVGDGTDTHSGVNTASRVVQARSCVMTSGSCAPSGAYSTVATTGTYPSLTYTGVHGSCYQFQYLISDNAGNPSAPATSANVRCLDTAAPTGGSVSNYNGFWSSTSITVTVNPGTDALSGMSTLDSDYVLERSLATLAGGSCGLFGSYADAGVAEAAGATSYTFTGITARCYAFRYKVKDAAGNAVTWMGTDVTKVDTTTPNAIAVDAGSGTNVPPVDRTSLASGTPFNLAATGGDEMVSFSWTDPNSTSDNLFYSVRTLSASTAFNNTGLVGSWDFDEPSVFPDRSGNGNNGTITGSTFVTGGMHGSAREFSTTTDKLTVPDSSSLDLPNDLSVEFWIYPKANTSTASVNPIQKFTGVMTDANFRVYLYGASHATVPNRLIVYATLDDGVPTWTYVSPAYQLPALDTWYHVVWTYSSTGAGRLYVNGIQRGTAVVRSQPLTTNAAPLQIGANATGFDNIVDEVRIYNRVLDAFEVADRAAIVATTTPYVDDVKLTQTTQYYHVLPRTGAGKLGTERTFTATYDATAPQVVITSPDQPSYTTSPPVNGTATDALSGVAAAGDIGITITCSGSIINSGGSGDCASAGTTHYWNGTQWTTTPTTLSASTCTGCGAPGTVTWAYGAAPDASYLRNNETYTVSVTATDVAGNTTSPAVTAAWTFTPSIVLTVDSSSAPPGTFAPGVTDQTWWTRLKVSTPSSGGFTLAANRVASNLVPLAAGMLSNSGHSSFSAASSVDGDTGTTAWSGASVPLNATVTVDLGSATAVGAVRLFASAEGYSCWYNVERSVDGSSWSPSSYLISPYDAGWNSTTFSAAQVYRYWRIRNTTPSCTSSTTFTEFALDDPPPTLTSGQERIPDKGAFTGSGSSTAAYSGTGLGFRVNCADTTNGYAGPLYSSTLWGAGGTCTAADGASAEYAGFPTAAQTISSTTAYSGSDQYVRVDYRLVVPSGQPSGTYTGDVIYTAATTP